MSRVMAKTIMKEDKSSGVRDLEITQFKKVVPKHMKKNVTPELMEKINKIIRDPAEIISFKENLLSYTAVMQLGKFKMSQYINAVRYVSHKLLGSTNINAYIKTFPDSHSRLLKGGASDKDISAYVSAYNKSKLVNLVLEQTFVPTYVLNAHLYQDALNTQAELMLYARSEKVRCDAANSLMVNLKRPEVQKLEVDFGVKEDSSIQALRESTLELVRQQRAMIQNGQLSVKAVAESEIIVEADDASD